MVDRRKIYWDSCVWISFLNETEGRKDNCAEVIRLAREECSCEIWASSLVLAEVLKAKCDGETLAIEQEKDQAFEQYMEQEFVVEVQLGHDVGIAARRLMRKYPVLKKPNDAVHLATAVLNNCDEFHTYDATDLLPLNGHVQRSDGQLLKICVPPPPVQAQLPLDVATPVNGASATTSAPSNSVADEPTADTRTALPDTTTHESSSTESLAVETIVATPGNPPPSATR